MQHKIKVICFKGYLILWKYTNTYNTCTIHAFCMISICFLFILVLNAALHLLSWCLLGPKVMEGQHCWGIWSWMDCILQGQVESAVSYGHCMLIGTKSHWSRKQQVSLHDTFLRQLEVGCCSFVEDDICMCLYCKVLWLSAMYHLFWYKIIEMFLPLLM